MMLAMELGMEIQQPKNRSHARAASQLCAIYLFMRLFGKCLSTTIRVDRPIQSKLLLFVFLVAFF